MTHRCTDACHIGLGHYLADDTREDKSIKLWAHVKTTDGEVKRVYVGQTYRNPLPYFAQTDAGTFPCRSIEEGYAICFWYRY